MKPSGNPPGTLAVAAVASTRPATIAARTARSVDRRAGPGGDTGVPAVVVPAGRSVGAVSEYLAPDGERLDEAVAELIAEVAP